MYYGPGQPVELSSGKRVNGDVFGVGMKKRSDPPESLTNELSVQFRKFYVREDNCGHPIFGRGLLLWP